MAYHMAQPGECFMCTQEEYVFCCVLWVFAHSTQQWSSQFAVLFESSVSLQIFCLLIPSITKNGILKSPTNIVEFSISLSHSASFCCVHLRICFEILQGSPAGSEPCGPGSALQGWSFHLAELGVAQKQNLAILMKSCQILSNTCFSICCMP